MLAKVRSAAIVGLDAVPIDVEVDVMSMGLPQFHIVGLPDKSVDEAKERVRSALKNSGFEFPQKRITVNLAPADIHKEGPSFDLPIAIGLLVASGQVEIDLEKNLFLGELSLDGGLRKTRGILPVLMYCKQAEIPNFIVPFENYDETRFNLDVDVVPATSLLALVKHFVEDPIVVDIADRASVEEKLYFEVDFKDIKGQEFAKRAMEIAAAGGHNMLLSGPPGTGKTMLAKAFSSILPPLTFEESIEVCKIYSVSGYSYERLSRVRPFRSPHHSISSVGLIGGGSNPKPGEITLAHRGVLFLDEFPEFQRTALEALRQPLEDGLIAISRANSAVTFPARFNLITTSNPCPCGYFGTTGLSKSCICSPIQIERYNKRLSGPILDRIDMHIHVPPVNLDKLTDQDLESEESDVIRDRVVRARELQVARFKGLPVVNNSEMGTKEIKEFCRLNEETLNLIKTAITKFSLSARSFGRIIKVARTIADLEGCAEIQLSHAAEALQFRVSHA